MDVSVFSSFTESLIQLPKASAFIRVLIFQSSLLERVIESPKRTKRFARESLKLQIEFEGEEMFQNLKIFIINQRFKCVVLFGALKVWALVSYRVTDFKFVIAQNY